MKFTVIIPVCNERETIRQIVQRIMAVPYAKQIIIVDDGSTDGARPLIAQLAADSPDIVEVYYHEKNQGKGAK